MLIKDKGSALKSLSGNIFMCYFLGPIFVITEYCPHGDLLNFLRKAAESLIIQDLSLESSFDSGVAEYKNMYLGKKYIRR